MDPHRNRIRSFLKHLEKHRDDRGVMADLRQGFSDGTEYRAWPHVAARCDLTRPREKAVWVFIGAAFAVLKGHTAKAGNLGETIRRIALEGTVGNGQDALQSFDARFRRLLTCDSTESVCAWLPGIIRTAERKGIGVNLEELYLDLTYWHERVKLRWAAAYWGGVNETGPEKGEAIP